MPQIAISGVGIISPLGFSYIDVLESFKNSKSGISRSEDKSIRMLPTNHAAYIKNFLPSEHIDLKSRLAKFAIQSSLSAIRDAKINTVDYAPSRKALIIGSEPASADLKKEMKTFKKIYADEVFNIHHPLDSGLFPEAILIEICRKANIQGRSYFHLGTCSAASQSIGEGKRLIENGMADVVLCGGASSRVDPLSMLRLIRVGALAPTSSEEVQTLSRPFDAKRNGFTMGEGAVMFVLEDLNAVIESGRKPYAILAGYGAALDGYSITDPHPEEYGMKLSMERALSDARITSEAIGYINAHGTSTKKNDFHESRAIKKVFKKSVSNIAISSTKSSHGHLMSAAGAMELIPAICAVKEGLIAPTLNLDDFDPECDLDYTPHIARTKEVMYSLSNSFGLGGQNASLIVKKYNV